MDTYSQQTYALFLTGEGPQIVRPIGQLTAPDSHVVHSEGTAWMGAWWRCVCVCTGCTVCSGCVEGEGVYGAGYN